MTDESNLEFVGKVKAEKLSLSYISSLLASSMVLFITSIAFLEWLWAFTLLGSFTTL